MTLQPIWDGVGSIFDGIGGFLVVHGWTIAIWGVLTYWLKNHYAKQKYEQDNKKNSVFLDKQERLKQMIEVNYVENIDIIRTEGNSIVSPMVVGAMVGMIFNHDTKYEDFDDAEKNNNLCYVGFVPEIGGWIDKLKRMIFGVTPEIIMCFAKDIKLDYDQKCLIFKNTTSLDFDGIYYNLVRGRLPTKEERDAIVNQYKDEVYKTAFENMSDAMLEVAKKSLEANPNVQSIVEIENASGGGQQQ